jgi:MSHA biogenesis protein MshL
MGQRSHPAMTFWVVLFLVFVASCATQDELQKAKGDQSLENLVEVQPATPAESVKQKEQSPLLELTLPQLDLIPKKSPAVGPRFSLSAEDVDVKTILFSLSKEIDQNIMIDPVIEKKVTLHLSNVTLGEMLDHVLTPLQLQYTIDGEFIQVTELEMQTRVFHLNYLISRREGAGAIQVSAGAPSGMSSSQIFSSEESDLWQEISLGLRQMIGFQVPQEKILEPLDASDFGSTAYVSINKQAGVIVVKAFPEDLLRVANYLEEVEGSVQRQVFIQARIIQVALKDEYKTGIDWTRISTLKNHEQGRHPSSGNENQQTRGVLDGEEQMNQMLATISLQGDVRILASPRIAALNNQRAVIKVATEDAVFVPSKTSPGVAMTTDYTPKPMALGVVLDVVPQININGDVTMSVFTRVRRKAGDRPSPDGQYKVPIVDVRESNNVVLARNGQTVVIGGMRKTHKQPKATGPLEGVPIIGNLFHEDRIDHEKSELVILLTPEIMVGEAIDDRWRIEEKRLKRFGLNRHTQ